jgi:hypothetical protein
MSIEVFTENSEEFNEVSNKMREYKAFDYGELAESYNEVAPNTIMRFPYPTASMANFRKVMKNWNLTINKDYIVKGLNTKDKLKCSILLQKKSNRVMEK